MVQKLHQKKARKEACKKPGIQTKFLKEKMMTNKKDETFDFEYQKETANRVSLTKIDWASPMETIYIDKRFLLSKLRSGQRLSDVTLSLSIQAVKAK